MYLRDFHHLVLPERTLRRQPRDRYATYQRDLHAIASEVLDENTLLEGDQYSYTELGDAVLAPIAEAGKLNDIDLVVYAYWTPEFDPDYSAFGPYFLERYSIDGKSFDICDNGSLASATALHIVDRYVRNASTLRNVLVLGMEQITIPRRHAAGIPIPARSSACAAILSPHEICNATCIVSVGQFSEIEGFNGFDPRTVIAQILAQAEIDASDTCLFVQRACAFHKRLRYLLDIACEKPAFEIHFLDTTPSALHTLACFGKLASPDRVNTRRHALIIDEDVESLRTAWSLIRLADASFLPSTLLNTVTAEVMQ